MSSFSPPSILNSEKAISAPFLDFKGISLWARVLSVYDGDTFTVAINLPGTDNFLCKLNIRIDGIDTPEKRSKNESIKALAMKSRKCLVECLTGCEFAEEKKEQLYFETTPVFVIIHSRGLDKYGRVLASVQSPIIDKPIEDVLIEKKLAYRYNGDKKPSEEEILLMFSNSINA